MDQEMQIDLYVFIRMILTYQKYTDNEHQTPNIISKYDVATCDCEPVEYTKFIAIYNEFNNEGKLYRA